MKYIYTISHPETNVIVYVGASVNVHERAKAHLNPNSSDATREWITDLLSSGKRPLFTIIDKTPFEWRELERDWIIKLIESGSPLLNRQIKDYRNKEYPYDMIDLTESDDADLKTVGVEFKITED